MGDEDNFDLDDDLGLDGGGGGGGDDDFGSSLDDMLDDDAGGGGGKAGGDGGLDAFFEDLSNIDEMEGGEPQPAAAPKAAAAAPAAAPPPPPRANYQPKGEKKGGFGKWMMILLLLGLGGAGGWWYLNQPPTEIIEEEGLPTQELALPADEVIAVDKPLVPRKAMPKPVEEPPPPPPKVETNYLVQVATCSFSKCRDEFADELRRDGLPVFFRSSGEKFDFIEVVSAQLFNLRDAQDWAEKVNQVNERAGVASVTQQTNGYRVSMGTFTSLDQAKETKIYLDELLDKKLPLSMEHIQKSYETIKIFAGPYASKQEAQQVLERLRGDNRFRKAFVVKK